MSTKPDNVRKLSRSERERINRLAPLSCAICYRVRNLGIDHDHATGEGRGRLCRECNAAIGLFRDNPDFLWKAILYLTKPGSIWHEMDRKLTQMAGEVNSIEEIYARVRALRD